jgi:uncharacterized membrane protein
VSFWVGGVAGLLATAPGTPEGDLADLVRRFSPLAVLSVATIVGTGLLASLDRLVTVGDLVAGVYGVALSAKALLVLPLVGLGALHRYRLAPRLEAAACGAARGFRRLLAVELGLMVVVLAAAGLMASTSPPTPASDAVPYASYQAAAGADALGPYEPDLGASELASLDEAAAGSIQLTVLAPDRVDHLHEGGQTVWLLVHDPATGEPVTDAEVTLDAWMTEHGHGTEPEADPVHVRDGLYRGETTWRMQGAWELRVNVTLPEGDVLRYAPTVFVGERADPLVTSEPIHAVEEEGHRIEVFLEPTPVRLGVQNLTVRVTPGNEALPENADVVANAEAPGGTGEGTSLDLGPWREGVWTLEEAIFTEEGTWELLVALQGEGTYVQTELPIDVQRR